MKKTLLALTIAALSANAFAADRDYTAAGVTAGDNVPNIIAKELVPVTAATELTTADTLTWTLGFSATNQNLVRVDLSNGAKFTNPPSLQATDGTGTLTSTIAAGGVGQSYALFQLNGPDTIDQAADVELALDNVTVASQANVDVRYRLYDDQVEANNASTRTLQDKSFPYATFANGLVFAAENPGVSKQIDVEAESKEFANGSDTSELFGGLTLKVNADTYASDLSATVDIEDFIGAGAELVVTGDFGAIAASAAGTLIDTVAATGVNATETEVTFDLGATTAVVELDKAALTYVVDGVTVIAPSEFGAKLVLGTGAGLNAAPAAVSNFATLAKNGASDDVIVTMKPKSQGGFYENVIRITNTSGIAGDVTITVINDDGVSASVALGDIAGQTSNTLGAGASTNQITVSDIYAAVPNLALARQGKLRLVVDATVPEGQIDVQSLVVSGNGNTLSRFE